MIDSEKVLTGLECLITDEVPCEKCPYDKKRSYCIKSIAKDVKDLLKEQEPKIGHWIFESKYCEAWSHTCSECGKRMTTGVGIYASFCWNCGAKMTGGEV